MKKTEMKWQSIYILKTKSLLGVKRESVSAHVEDELRIFVDEDKMVCTYGPRLC